MPEYTDHYGLIKFQSGSSISDDDYKFGDEDRDLIDARLWLGAEGHHHVGVSLDAPPDGPSLSISETPGALEAGETYYYQIVYVDEDGRESPPSDASSITIPSALLAPSAPTLTTDVTGGVLEGGNYQYVLSAYAPGDNRAETRALNVGMITVAAGSTNIVTVIFPDLPEGAEGFNIYRRKPGDAIYLWIDSIATDMATPPTEYVDDGSVEEDCNRTLPLANRTATVVAVDVTLPGATPGLPENWTWKVYRTLTEDDFTSSFLHHVVENTTEGSEFPAIVYTDIGLATTGGTPALAGVGSPEKILLTDGAEVQGTLPMSFVDGFPVEVIFSQEGYVEAAPGVFLWTCPYATAEIIGVRATLGVGASPADTPVVVGLRKGTGQIDPVFEDLFSIGNGPTVEVGHQFSDLVAPSSPNIVYEDMLVVDILQAGGGGATPTDHNLTVSVLLKARFT